MTRTLHNVPRYHKNYDYIRLTDSLVVSMTGAPRSPLLATHEYVTASRKNWVAVKEAILYIEIFERSLN